MVLHNLRWSTS